MPSLPVIRFDISSHNAKRKRRRSSKPARGKEGFGRPHLGIRIRAFCIIRARRAGMPALFASVA
jgi:hypothetical protein